jgi:DNA-directed RNA polymerase specialized sigma24 family protein
MATCDRCHRHAEPHGHGICLRCRLTLTERYAYPEVLALLTAQVPSEHLPVLRRLLGARLIAAHPPVVNVAISEPAKSYSDPQESPGSQLRTLVDGTQRWWRATLDQERRDDAQAKAMASTGQLGVEFLVSFQAKVVFRRLYRRYLRRRFRYDLQRSRWLRGARPPQSRFEANLLTDAAMAYGVYNGSFYRCLEAVVLAVIDEKDIDGRLADAVAAMQPMWSSQLSLHGAVMDSPYAHQREAAIIGMSGWVATQISLDKNPRLQKALLQESDEPHAKLLERLPTHVSTAWRERDPGEALTVLRTRVARGVEQESLHQKASLSQLPPDAAHRDPLPGNFPKQLEAQDEVMAWLRRAGLTLLEETVTIRKLADLSEQEIADALGCSVGSVKQAWLRARGKLKGSASG